MVQNIENYWLKSCVKWSHTHYLPEDECAQVSVDRWPAVHMSCSQYHRPTVPERVVQLQHSVVWCNVASESATTPHYCSQMQQIQTFTHQMIAHRPQEAPLSIPLIQANITVIQHHLDENVKFCLLKFYIFTHNASGWPLIRRRFWHATRDCIAPYVDIILHRGRFWAKSAASGSVRWCCSRSCWMVLSHVMRGTLGLD